MWRIHHVSIGNWKERAESCLMPSHRSSQPLQKDKQVLPPLAKEGLMECPKVRLAKERRLGWGRSKTGRSQCSNNSMILSCGCLGQSGCHMSAGYFGNSLEETQHAKCSSGGTVFLPGAPFALIFPGFIRPSRLPARSTFPPGIREFRWLIMVPVVALVFQLLLLTTQIEF